MFRRLFVQSHEGPWTTYQKFAIAIAFIVAAMPLDPQNTSALLPMFVLLGATLNAVQTTMYALAANVYPNSRLGACRE